MRTSWRTVAAVAVVLNILVATDCSQRFILRELMTGNVFVYFESEGRWFVCDHNGENCQVFTTRGDGSIADCIEGCDGGGNSIAPQVFGLTKDQKADRRNALVAAAPRALLGAKGYASVVNVTTRRVESEIPISGRALQTAVSSDGEWAAVRIAAQGDFLDILDLKALRRSFSVPVAAACRPRGVAFIPGTADFALACSGTSSVRFYSATGTGGVSGIPEFRDCPGAARVAFTADGSRGVFSCGGTVQIYDVLSASKITEFTGYGAVLSIGLPLDGTRAYLGTTSGGPTGSLVIVNMETYEVIRGVPVDGQPVAIWLEEGRDRVYVMGAAIPRVIRMNREGVVDHIEPLASKPLGGFFVTTGGE